MRLPLNPLIAGLIALAPLSAQALELVTEDDPPHNMMRDGKIVGVSTEKLEEAFKRTGNAPHIELMPWARAYQFALSQTGYCVYSAGRTAEREALFKWIGPISSMDWVLYGRADNPKKPAKLEDVRKEVIGGYLQDVISVWLADHSYQVDALTKDATNPKKMMLGRINYWASSKPRGTALLEADDLSKQIVPLFTFGHTDLYLACHLSTPDGIVQKLNDALAKMKADGSAAKIEARYAK